MIHENGIYSTVFIQRATVTPEQDSASSLSSSPPSTPAGAENSNSKETWAEYAVGCNVGHESKNKSLRYRIPWYEYCLDHDTFGVQ